MVHFCVTCTSVRWSLEKFNAAPLLWTLLCTDLRCFKYAAIKKGQIKQCEREWYFKYHTRCLERWRFDERCFLCKSACMALTKLQTQKFHCYMDPRNPTGGVSASFIIKSQHLYLCKQRKKISVHSELLWNTKPWFHRDCIKDCTWHSLWLNRSTGVNADWIKHTVGTGCSGKSAIQP